MSPGVQLKQEPGMKFDGGKVRADLWYLPFLDEVHAVLVFGADKYSVRGQDGVTVLETGAWNWARGMSYSRLFNSASRHLWAWWWRREDCDSETGLHHMAHLTACAMFIFGLQRLRRGADDRPPPDLSGC